MRKNNQEYVIGVDGGGTKTTVVLADGEGNVLKVAKSGPSSPRNIGIKKTAANLAEGIKRVLPKRKNVEIPSVFIGLPSVQEEFKSRTGEIKRELLKQKGLSFLPKNNLAIGSDQLVAFRSGTNSKNGVLLIAGTGCVAHGWRGSREAKASGWGWLADEGSAFWVGQKVYQAVLKDLDGRGPKTLLKKLIFQKYKIKEDPNLLNKLIYSETPIAALSLLSSVCDIAAKSGDKIARNILIEAGKEQALSVNTVIKKLNLQKASFPLVLVGGMFNSKIFLGSIKKSIKKFVPKVEFIQPKAEPVMGAVRLAIEQLK